MLQKFSNLWPYNWLGQWKKLRYFTHNFTTLTTACELEHTTSNDQTPKKRQKKAHR